MMYNEKDFTAYLAKLEQFKEISWVNNQLQLMKKPNFWTILEYGDTKGPNKRSAHEIRSSKMLRWLIDANETHHLGNLFAQKLMHVIGEKYTFDATKNKAIKALSEKMDIDVLYQDFSQNICIAIELKQFAKEGTTAENISQLDKYEKAVQDRIIQHNRHVRPHYIYLTPLKDTPSNKNWHAVSYTQLIAILQQILDEALTPAIPYAHETKKIISDFKEDLQRTVDYLQKDHTSIKECLTEKEKALTLALAEEIQHDTTSTYLQKLRMLQNKDDDDLEHLILIIKDYTKAQLQNHSPNDAVRILIRKIYNYFSAQKEINVDDLKHHTINETLSPIKQQLIDHYHLCFDKISLTQGKGQGLYFYHKDNKYRIYLSGDAHGNFPNDGVQLLTHKGKTIVQLSSKMKNNSFFVQNEKIIHNKISTKAGSDIDLALLIEQHIMPAITELNHNA